MQGRRDLILTIITLTRAWVNWARVRARRWTLFSPEGGIVLNIFGVLHGRVLFLSRDANLSLTLPTLNYRTSATLTV
jgi:hypothetical protein